MMGSGKLRLMQALIDFLYSLPLWVIALSSFVFGALCLVIVNAIVTSKRQQRHLSEINSLREASNTETQQLALELASATNEAARVPGLENKVAQLNASVNQEQQSVARLQTQAAADKLQAEEKITLLKEARDEMSLQFKAIASELLEQKSKTFTNQNKDQIGQLLNPLREQIQRFEKQVDDKYSNEAKERHSLLNEIKQLQTLNAQISEEANNLTSALTGQVKTQGNWGELVLSKVLETSGLEKGREYDTEVSMKSEDGQSFRPDVVVYLPDDKAVVIDSKVSLTAYERYCSADNEAEQQRHLKEHIASLRQHVKSLSDKRYQDLLGERSLDFVFLFVPVEAAFVEAVRNDVSLYDEAFQKNIGLVAPSTLLGMLRTIQNIWRSEYQNRHAIEIGRKAGKLYDKFTAFIEDLDKVGLQLERTRQAHEAATNKLVSGRGNLVKTSEDIKKLGARASKQLDSELVAKAVENEDAAPRLDEKNTKAES